MFRVFQWGKSYFVFGKLEKCGFSSILTFGKLYFAILNQIHHPTKIYFTEIEIFYLNQILSAFTIIYKILNLILL